MYRHIWYNKKAGEIYEATWNKEGERITITHPFKTFLFTETNKPSKFKSIYGTNLEYREFENDSKRYWFAEKCEDMLFYNLPAETQYAIGKYGRKSQDNFSEHPLRIFFLDIECPAEKEFPKPEDAKYEIDLMTIYDSLTGLYHMWGKHPWDKGGVEQELKRLNGEGGKLKIVNPDNIKYYEIFDEKERLEHMLTFWEDNVPDIYTGWNIDGFDTQYIVNRLKLKLGGDEYTRLSPYGKISTRDGFDKFGNPRIEYKIQGVNVMDYMDVFKTFTFGAQRPSWKLDDVASSPDVLGCGKIEYTEANLFSLSRSDWGTYCLYNLVDVALLVSMDADSDFLETARETGYEGFSNTVDSLGKVKVIVGSISNSALLKGQVVETRKRSDKVSFEGGYVKEPIPAMVTNLFTYDATSLYPRCMLELNTSLESKVGKITERTAEFIYYTEWGEDKKIATEDLAEEFISKGYVLSRADVIFDQKKKGVIYDFVKKQFDNKQRFSKLAKQYRDAGDTANQKKYERKTKITKILVNSCYGIISANISPFYDLDIARSITLTGQGVTKTAINAINELFWDKFDQPEGVEAVTSADTDSCMITFDAIVEKFDEPLFSEDNKLNVFGHKMSGYMGSFINDRVNTWVKENMFCQNPNYDFGREKACTSALIFKKKNYAFHVVDNEGETLEGERCMKYTGLKVVQSKYSPSIKIMMGELYYETLSKYLKMGHSEARTHLTKIIRRHKEEFMKGDYFDVAIRNTANNLNLYKDGGTNGNGNPVEGFLGRYEAGSGCGAQVKATIFYNHLVEDLGLQSKYQIHQGGVKAMWVYVMPNEYGIEMVAGDGKNIPEEFNLKIDYQKQWNTIYLKVPEQIFETIGWRFPNLIHEEKVDFDEMFG